MIFLRGNLKMAEPELTTYFGLPIRDGGVPLVALQARDFWPRWKAIMGEIDAPSGLVSLDDVRQFAEKYVLEI